MLTEHDLKVISAQIKAWPSPGIDWDAFMEKDVTALVVMGRVTQAALKQACADLIFTTERFKDWETEALVAHYLRINQ